jgi:hypothetical protein
MFNNISSFHQSYTSYFVLFIFEYNNLITMDNGVTEFIYNLHSVNITNTIAITIASILSISYTG